MFNGSRRRGCLGSLPYSRWLRPNSLNTAVPSGFSQHPPPDSIRCEVEEFLFLLLLLRIYCLLTGQTSRAVLMFKRLAWVAELEVKTFRWHCSLWSVSQRHHQVTTFCNLSYKSIQCSVKLRFMSRFLPPDHNCPGEAGGTAALYQNKTHFKRGRRTRTVIHSIVLCSAFCMQALYYVPG